MEKLKQAILFLTISVCNLANACDCPILDVTRLEPNSTVVFKGKVLQKARSGQGMFSYTFSPTKTYKGNNLHNIIVLTPSAGASCGVSFSTDQEYIVFTHKIGDEFHSSLCASWPDIESFSEETRKLEKYFQKN